MDAAAQSNLRKKAALPPLTPGQSADIALAIRGGKEMVAQSSATVAQRPEIRTAGTTAFFRFHAKDAFLALSGPRRLALAASVFVFAAPR